MDADPQQLAARRRQAVLLCIATTVFVASVQLIVGWRFHLISVTAEGLHTAADLLDSLIALVLVLAASKPADREHPFGHGKYDSLAAIIEGTFVFAAGAWAIAKATMVLLGMTRPDPQPTLSAMLCMALAGGIYLLVSSWVLRVSTVIGSPAVRAEALHLRTHVYIALGLLAGLALTRLAQARAWPNADRVDAIAAIILGVFLLSVAGRIIVPGFRQLMDQALPKDDMERILACLDEVRDQFVEIHAIRTRSAGTDRHVDFHLVVPPEMTVEAAHRLSHRLEQQLRERVPGTRLLVHVEPATARSMRAYRARDRLGALVLSQQSPTEAESGHHESPDAHEL